MSADVEVQYIEDRPHFDALADLRQEALELPGFITALATGNDILQRATDLHIAAQEFLRKVELVICDVDDDIEHEED